MRISDRYIGHQVLSGTLFAIMLLSLLLVVGNLFQKIRPLLVELNAPLSVLWDFVVSVLPVSLIFTVPWAFLSAVLLVFGRMSSDNELIGFRVAGMGLARLAAPVIVLGFCFSAICLWLNLDVAPQAKRRVDDIVTRTIIQDPRALLRAGADQARMKNVKVESERSEGDVFYNFHIFVVGDKNKGDSGAYIHAETAETVVDNEKKQIRLRLTGAYIDGEEKPGKEFTMLSEDLEWIAIDYSDKGLRKAKPGAMTNQQIDEFLLSRPDLPERYRRRYEAEQTRRYTSSLACVAFALVGVPLGLKARRRDTSTGLVLSLAIGAIYFMAGSVLGDEGGASWILWIPNIACLILGIILFRRARFR